MSHEHAVDVHVGARASPFANRTQQRPAPGDRRRDEDDRVRDERPQITGCSVLSFAKNGVCSLLMNFVAPSAPLVASSAGTPSLTFAQYLNSPKLIQRCVGAVYFGSQVVIVSMRLVGGALGSSGFAEITDVSSGVTMV